MFIKAYLQNKFGVERGVTDVPEDYLIVHYGGVTFARTTQFAINAWRYEQSDIMYIRNVS